MTPLVFSYTRFSSLRQKQGDSKRRQDDLTKIWCERNGYVLDVALSIGDEGKSAYKAKHLHPEAGLGRFLEAIKQGRVPRGSYLAIEKLDRLSRQDIEKALALWSSILRAGVKIVTVSDGKVYDEASLTNITDVILALLTFSTGNLESKNKADRLREKWEQRRKNAGVKKMTGMAPAWLTLSEDRTTFHIRKGCKETITRIFTAYASGTGVLTIAKQLNADRIPVIVRPEVRNINTRGVWKPHNIQKLLKHKAVIGHFQPGKMVDDKNTPTGELLTTYYPRVIEDELFYKVQGRLAAIPPKRGRVSEHTTNLFTGKLVCPYCGSRMDIFFSYPTRTTKKGIHKYTPIRNIKCMNALAGKCISVGWRLEELEETFLEFAAEVKAHLSTTNNLHNIQEGITTATATLQDYRKRLQRYMDIIETADNPPQNILTRITELEASVKETEASIQKQESALLAAKAHNPFDDLQDLSLSTPDIREKVANAVRATFSRIELYFAGDYELANKVEADIKAMADAGKKRTGVAAVAFRNKWRIEENRFFVAHLNAPGKAGRLTYPRMDIVDGKEKESKLVAQARLRRSTIDVKEQVLADIATGATEKELLAKYKISLPTIRMLIRLHTSR